MASRKGGDKLTETERKVVAEYVRNGHHGGHAYRDAIGSTGSPHTCTNQFYKLMKRPAFKAAIESIDARVVAAKDAVIERYAVTKANILRELALIGFARMDDYLAFGDDGRPSLDFAKIQANPELAAAISELVVDEIGTDGKRALTTRVRFKLHEKRSALVDLGKNLGMFVEKHELTGADGGPVEIKEIRRVIVDPRARAPGKPDDRDA